MTHPRKASALVPMTRVHAGIVGGKPRETGAPHPWRGLRAHIGSAVQTRPGGSFPGKHILRGRGRGPLRSALWDVGQAPGPSPLPRHRGRVWDPLSWVFTVSDSQAAGFQAPPLGLPGTAAQRATVSQERTHFLSRNSERSIATSSR